MMNTIETFTAACKVLGYDEATVLPDFSGFPEHHREGMKAHAELVIMTEAVNAGKEGEPIYYPVFWKGSPSGGGFRFHSAGVWNSFSNVGARLCFKDYDDAVWAGENWTALYEKYHTYSS